MDHRVPVQRPCFSVMVISCRSQWASTVKVRAADVAGSLNWRPLPSNHVQKNALARKAKSIVSCWNGELAREIIDARSGDSAHRNP